MNLEANFVEITRTPKFPMKLYSFEVSVNGPEGVEFVCRMELEKITHFRLSYPSRYVDKEKTDEVLELLFPRLYDRVTHLTFTRSLEEGDFRKMTERLLKFKRLEEVTLQLNKVSEMKALVVEFYQKIPWHLKVAKLRGR